jgi:putative isomerase
MFTGFLPLWCGVATPEQAADLVHLHYGDQDFRAAWGVRSLSNKEAMYSLVPSSNPSDWLGPVWIIVNYFVLERTASLWLQRGSSGTCGQDPCAC